MWSRRDILSVNTAVHSETMTKYISVIRQHTNGLPEKQTLAAHNQQPPISNQIQKQRMQTNSTDY